MQIHETDGTPAHDNGTSSDAAADATGDKVVSLSAEGMADTLADDSEVDETDADGDEAGDDEEQPRRRSRNQRRRDRVARLRAELALARQRAAMPRAGADRDLVEPRQSDFGDDYLAYDRALRDFQIRRALRDERRRDEDLQAHAEAALAFREKVESYNGRLETLRSRIPDFNETMRAAAGVEIRNDVRDLILGSSKGPLLAYYLAKNPEALDALNRMPPSEAARRVGNLEARIRGPHTTATGASAPITPPRGNASASRALDPERMSHDDYRKARAEGRL